MEGTPEVQSEPKSDDVQPPRRERRRIGNVLSFVVGLVGVVALAATGWVYTETQREILRISTDIAQMRLSLELFGRQQGAPAGTDTTAVQDLSNRLTILEENWRTVPPPVAATGSEPALPELPAPAADTAAANAEDDTDCLPTNTRLLVASGDNYKICGNPGSVAIGVVDNGFLSLADGTVIAAGGNIGLPGTSCMIAVVTAGENGMTGYGEIRVTC